MTTSPKSVPNGCGKGVEENPVTVTALGDTAPLLKTLQSARRNSGALLIFNGSHLKMGLRKERKTERKTSPDQQELVVVGHSILNFQDSKVLFSFCLILSL